MVTQLKQYPVDIDILMTRGDHLEPFTIKVEMESGSWAPDGGLAQVRRQLDRDSDLVAGLNILIDGPLITVAWDYPKFDEEGLFYWDIRLWDADHRITFAQGQFVVGKNVTQEIVGP